MEQETKTLEGLDRERYALLRYARGQVRHCRDHVRRLHRLRYVHVEACGERSRAVFCAGVSGQRDSRDAASAVWRQLAHFADQVEAILTVHSDVT